MDRVVGYSYTVYPDQAPHAFSWTAKEGMIDLGTLGGCCSIAYAVNGAGQIAGGAWGDAGSRAVLWEVRAQ